MFGNLINFDTSLWEDFQRLQREMDALFRPTPGLASIRAVARGSFPAVNIGSTPDAVHVYAFAPGLNRDTLDLSIQRNLLTITGERKVEVPGKDKGTYHLRERFTGSFSRTISLPEDVDPDKVTAVYRDGVLIISVGKQESFKPRQIQIQSA